MKKFTYLLSLFVILSACTLQKTYIEDYGQRIQILKNHFPEIYDMYRNGTVIIDNVYTYEKDGEEKVRVSYHYR